MICVLVPPTDLTFVRHGQTVANASGVYLGKNLNRFSLKGEKQVRDLTATLTREAGFGLILCSPSPRAMNTILPYLKVTTQKALIWPNLYECCTGRRPKGAHAVAYKFGGKITIPTELKRYFYLQPGNDRFPVAPNYNQGLGQVDAFLGEFNAQFSHRRILLVGHSGQGGHFLHAITGKWTMVENAKPIHLALP